MKPKSISIGNEGIEEQLRLMNANLEIIAKALYSLTMTTGITNLFKRT